MRTTAAAVVVVLAAGAAGVAAAQDHARCPMHSTGDHQAQVDHRHQGATGVPTQATEHHFILAPDGGSIRLGVTDARETEARDRIRAHLQVVARSFAAGDFSLPMQIHDRTPPGVETMKARKDKLRYAYSESPEGGVVTISTADRQALAAVHEFLRFQIRDHGTADPLE
jgi:hypothetical protein